MIQKPFLFAFAVLSLADVRRFFSTKEGGENEGDIEFIDMRGNCVNQTEIMIEKELIASMKYLSMGEYFSRDKVNRPGFARFFFESATKEREHAYKLIAYLAMRGRYLNDNKGNSTTYKPNLSSLIRNADKATGLGLENKLRRLEDEEDGKSTSGLIALQNAMEMVVAGTNETRNLIIVCEKDKEFNHYHVSYWNIKLESFCK